MISKTHNNLKRFFVMMALAIATILSGCNSSDEIPNIGNLREVDVSTLKPGIAPGKIAQDIVGFDSAGERFMLSDYRGKVVLLDFWGDW